MTFSYRLNLRPESNRTKLRRRLSAEQNHRCVYCGIPTIDEYGHSHSATIEHVKPLSRGGADRYSNMVMACYSCNLQRGNKPVEQFLNEIKNAKCNSDNISSVDDDFVELQNKIEILRKEGYRISNSNSAQRMRRSLENYRVIEAVKSGISNPFEKGSREYKLFNQYAASPRHLLSGCFV